MHSLGIQMPIHKISTYILHTISLGGAYIRLIWGQHQATTVNRTTHQLAENGELGGMTNQITALVSIGRMGCLIANQSEWPKRMGGDSPQSSQCPARLFTQPMSARLVTRTKQIKPNRGMTLIHKHSFVPH